MTPDLTLQQWLDSQDKALSPTQQALLDAAAKAFTLYGFAAASIDAIVAQIGVTKGSVYYHYRSKSALFFAVHRRAMMLNVQAQLPLAQDSAHQPVQALYQMCHRHIRCVMDSLYYQRVAVQGVELHQMISTTPQERATLEEVMTIRDAYEALFRTVIEQGMNTGHFVRLDASLAAKSILGSLNWVTAWYRPRPEDAPATRLRIAHQFARQATHGVAHENTDFPILPLAP